MKIKVNLLSLLMFIIIANGSLYTINHFITDKQWAMMIFGMIMYMYGSLEDIIFGK